MFNFIPLKLWLSFFLSISKILNRHEYLRKIFIKTSKAIKVFINLVRNHFLEFPSMEVKILKYKVYSYFCFLMSSLQKF